MNFSNLNEWFSKKLKSFNLKINLEFIETHIINDKFGL